MTQCTPGVYRYDVFLTHAPTNYSDGAWALNFRYSNQSNDYSDGALKFKLTLKRNKISWQTSLKLQMKTILRLNFY